MINPTDENPLDVFNKASALYKSLGEPRNQAERILIRMMKTHVHTTVNAAEHEYQQEPDLKAYDYWHGQVEKHMAILDAYRYAIEQYRDMESESEPPA